MTMTIVRTLLMSLILVLASSAAESAPTITYLESTNGTQWLDYVKDAHVSDDGQVVVATYENISSSGSRYWNSENGWVAENWLLNGVDGIDADGSTIVGGDHSSSGVAWRWTAELGYEQFPPTGSPPISGAHAVSADGSTTSGYDGFEAVAWVGAEVFRTSLGFVLANAEAANGDGSVIYISVFDPRTVWRWSPGVGIEQIGAAEFPVGTQPIVEDCNRAGTIAVGKLIGGDPSPCLWTDDYSPLPTGDYGATAWAKGLNETGELIVGYVGEPEVALIWTESGDSVQALSDYLTNEGLDLTGWTLNRATDMTPDGRYIVGGGIFNGVAAAFLVDMEGETSSTPSTTSASGLSLTVFPNPATSSTRITFDMNARQGSGSLRTFDASGRLIKQFALPSARGYVDWDTSELESGVYFLKLETGAWQAVKRLVVR